MSWISNQIDLFFVKEKKKTAGFSVEGFSQRYSSWKRPGNRYEMTLRIENSVLWPATRESVIQGADYVSRCVIVCPIWKYSWTSNFFECVFRPGLYTFGRLKLAAARSLIRGIGVLFCLGCGDRCCLYFFAGAHCCGNLWPWCLDETCGWYFFAVLPVRMFFLIFHGRLAVAGYMNVRRSWQRGHASTGLGFYSKLKWGCILVVLLF